MHYRGGGICHTYMREIENRFEEMRLKQVGSEGIPQSTWDPQDTNHCAEEPLSSTAEAVTSVQNVSMVGGDDEDVGEGEDSEGEWLDVDYSGEDNCLGRENSDVEDYNEDEDDDEIYQGTYGMSEY